MSHTCAVDQTDCAGAPIVSSLPKLVPNQTVFGGVWLRPPTAMTLGKAAVRLAGRCMYAPWLSTSGLLQLPAAVTNTVSGNSLKKLSHSWTRGSDGLMPTAAVQSPNDCSKDMLTTLGAPPGDRSN